MTWWKARVVTDPEILSGKPCIKGTRIPVTTVINALFTEHHWGIVLSEFPSLTVDDLMAALMFEIEGLKEKSDDQA